MNIRKKISCPESKMDQEEILASVLPSTSKQPMIIEPQSASSCRTISSCSPVVAFISFELFPVCSLIFDLYPLKSAPEEIKAKRVQIGCGNLAEMLVTYKCVYQSFINVFINAFNIFSEGTVRCLFS